MALFTVRLVAHDQPDVVVVEECMQVATLAGLKERFRRWVFSTGTGRMLTELESNDSAVMTFSGSREDVAKYKENVETVFVAGLAGLTRLR